jgi:hypothetical protein
MVVTFSGILATGWRARAQEPARDAGDAGAAEELLRPAPAAGDGGVAPPVSETAPPPAEKAAPAGDKSAPPVVPLTAAEHGDVRAAPAAPLVDVPIPGGPAQPAQEETGPKGKKKKGKGNKVGKSTKIAKDAAPGEEHAELGAVAIRGRVFARSEYDRREILALNDMLVLENRTVDSLDLSVPSARLSFHYRAPVEWLTAVAEVDIAGRPDMKDGYVQARDEHFSLRAGQFRVPTSSIEMTSPWTLPTVRRGLLHDVLVDRMDASGRRPGVMIGWRDRKIDLSPRIMIGAFQGSFLAQDPTRTARDTDLLNAMKFPSQTVVARGEIEALGFELGAWYENRIGSPVLFQTYRYWAGGADLHYDHVFESSGLRFWLEGMAGSSWYEHASKVADGKDAMFTAGRVQVAYRFGGTVDDAPFLEPYVLASVLDPDTQVTADFLWEAVVGVNLGYWRRARLSLQGEINRGQRNFPAGFFVGPPPNRQAVVLQAGVAF